jgi:hypothetical protein
MPFYFLPLQVFFFTEKANKARLVPGLVRGKVAHQATPLFPRRPKPELDITHQDRLG